eukprot:FR742420.1.p1 GENE.FR742420.1~~FR742420.1.p1  ORF type:complete len:168 (-),score=32.49 FR742420.1:241-744(-)
MAEWNQGRQLTSLKGKKRRRFTAGADVTEIKDPLGLGSWAASTAAAIMCSPWLWTLAVILCGFFFFFFFFFFFSARTGYKFLLVGPLDNNLPSCGDFPCRPIHCPSKHPGGHVALREFVYLVDHINDGNARPTIRKRAQVIEGPRGRDLVVGGILLKAQKCPQPATS